MVHFDDFRVVALSRQGGSHALGKGDGEGDAGGEIRRIDHGDALRRAGHRRFIGGRQAGGAEHPGAAGGLHPGRVLLHGGGMGEVDQQVGTGNQRLCAGKRGARSRIAGAAAGEFGPGGDDFLGQ